MRLPACGGFNELLILIFHKSHALHSLVSAYVYIHYSPFSLQIKDKLAVN